MTSIPEEQKAIEDDTLNSDDVGILVILACQDETFDVGWQKAADPLTACGDRLCGRNNHEHVIVSTDNSHHTYGATFFDVPMHSPNLLSKYQITIIEKEIVKIK